MKILEKPKFPINCDKVIELKGDENRRNIPMFSMLMKWLWRARVFFQLSTREREMERETKQKDYQTAKKEA